MPVDAVDAAVGSRLVACAGRTLVGRRSLRLRVERQPEIPNQRT